MLKLLVPVDGSKHSLGAVLHAAHMSLDHCVSGIVLLNVQEPLEHGRAAAFHSLSALRDIEHKHGEAALQNARRILDDADANYVAQIEVGPVAKTIAQTAAAEHCDTIVMGTAAHSLAGAWVAGRLARQVARITSVPVTFVK